MLSNFGSTSQKGNLVCCRKYQLTSLQFHMQALYNLVTFSYVHFCAHERYKKIRFGGIQRFVLSVSCVTYAGYQSDGEIVRISANFVIRTPQLYCVFYSFHCSSSCFSKLSVLNIGFKHSAMQFFPPSVADAAEFIDDRKIIAGHVAGCTYVREEICLQDFGGKTRRGKKNIWKTPSQMGE